MEAAPNTWEMVMEIEDHLQANHVFRNGFDGKPCHSDSYMTLVDFPSLDAAFAKSEFSHENWLYAIDYWLTNENMQPPLKLVARTIARKITQEKANGKG